VLSKAWLPPYTMLVWNESAAKPNQLAQKIQKWQDMIQEVKARRPVRSVELRLSSAFQQLADKLLNL
jgi:hypothetical protein